MRIRRVRRVRACGRAECTGRAHADPRGLRRVRACGRSRNAPNVRVRKPADPVRPFLRFTCVELVSNGASPLGHQGGKASLAGSAAQKLATT